MKTFTKENMLELWKREEDSSGEDNGQITIIGGSKLFHGAPIFSLKAASRLVDMVFFGSPEPSVGEVVAKIKSKLSAFIWVPWEEIGEYVSKSEATLIGPGFLRFHSEKVPHEQRFASCDEACKQTTEITRKLLTNYPDKKWVIDGGSLQVLQKEWIPEGAVITPNNKEYRALFGNADIEEMARKHKCVIVTKGPVYKVTDGRTSYEIGGGNAGLTKGGVGDTLAGIIVGLLAKNPPVLAAAAGSFLIKRTAEKLFEKVGYNFSADDVAENVFLNVV